MAREELRRLRDKTAVVGVGTSPFARSTGRDLVSLTAEAFGNALEDAGLRKESIDGLIVNMGPDCDRLPQLLGLEVEYAFQTWSHGRLSGPSLQLAALVAYSGLASYVACIGAVTAAQMRQLGGPEDREAFRPGGGTHWEFPHYGMSHPGALAAMAFRRYLHLYGGRAEDLGAVAVAQRKHASLNPNAVYRQPLTLEDYLRARYVIEPLRLYDFAAVNDGAVCLIVTTADRARDCRKPPVYISGMQGMRAGRQHVVFSMMGLGAGAQDVFRYTPPATMRVYEMAGVAREEVDLLLIYDSFSPEVIFGLEQFGFCPTGEALAWIQGGRIEVGGDLPVNTHGGHLSEGMVGGWGHLAEAVRQLRGECGERQVKGARVAQYIMGPFVSLLFTRQ